MSTHGNKGYLLPVGVGTVKNAAVGNKAWLDDHTITIAYTITGSPASLSITIKADYVIQKYWSEYLESKLTLDGNLLPENTTPANAGGVAPSADNYVKTVTLSD